LWLYQFSSSDQPDIYFILLCFLGLGIDHFYYNCPLQRLPCSDLFIHKMVSFSSPEFIIMPTMCTLSTVLNIHSTEGRKEKSLFAVLT
jgi:olfactory receptor